MVSFLTFSLPLIFLGIQDAVERFGTSRAAYDTQALVLEKVLQSLGMAHDRLQRDFLRLRDCIPDPAVFFQLLLERDPDLVITFDMLSYYATLFDWDSTLNFREVIAGHSSVSAWLASHKVGVSVEEPKGQPSVKAREVTPLASVQGDDEEEDGAGELAGDVEMADAKAVPPTSSPARGSMAASTEG